ncbi:hypothetical protein ACK3SF_03195 [Candidatus Nanosalina sp. VS9-1]|uniref:hypothetical protein n=1 Tax=Candidatus Nanosalina sp. VS9-1 TaxID=3388566 RepID=UPI0039E059F1
MADDDSDFKDILEGTVDEVKDRIRDLDTPDYEGLLDAEKEGKDRKTVKEFLESKLPTDDEEEDSEEESEEEIVEEIEEETSGGLLGSYSPTSVLAGGVILGLVIGFVAAGFAGVSGTADTGTQADAELVRQSVQTVAGVGLNTTPDVSEPVVRHSMYNMNVSTDVPTENGTVTQSQEVFVTLDGEYLFIAQKQFGQYIRPLDLQNAVQRAQAAQQQQTVNESQTGDSSDNTTE